MRPVVSVIVVVTLLVLIGCFFFLFRSNTKDFDPSGSAPQSNAGEEGVLTENEKVETGGGKRKEIPEDDIAILDPNNPLVVTFALRPELGEISIERFDKDGNQTGKPLASGTKVQIADPVNPGKRLVFTVP